MIAGAARGPAPRRAAALREGAGAVADNRLMSHLPAGLVAAMQRRALRRDFASDAVIQRAGAPFDQLCFPLSGLLVLSLPLSAGGVEAGLIGPEGFACPCGLAGAASPYDVIAETRVDAMLVNSADLARGLRAYPGGIELLLRFEHVLGLQAACAAASAACKLQARLARALLMRADRLGDAFPFVHRAIAVRMNVRRASVTEAVHVLEGEGAIRAWRGEARVIDRAKLRRLAGGAYGPAEARYRDLIERGATLRAPRRVAAVRPDASAG